MENKKSTRANLEKRRGSYFAIGMVLSLSAALIAFEYESVYELPTLRGEIGGEEIQPEEILRSIPKKKVVTKKKKQSQKKKLSPFSFLVNNEPEEIDSLVVDSVLQIVLMHNYLINLQFL